MTSRKQRSVYTRTRFPFHFRGSLFLLQTSELARRIRDAEKDVKRLVSEELTSEDGNSRSHPHQRESTDSEAQQRDSDSVDGGSDDDDDETDDEGRDSVSLNALEERFHGLEEEVAILVADVHDLALYTKLNITGFMKILKVRIALI